MHQTIINNPFNVVCTITLPHKILITNLCSLGLPTPRSARPGDEIETPKALRAGLENGSEKT